MEESSTRALRPNIEMHCIAVDLERVSCPEFERSMEKDQANDEKFYSPRNAIPHHLQLVRFQV